jgi:DNA-binding MarR family transcriptional regulator
MRAHFTFRLLVLSNTLAKGAERLYDRFGLRLPEWRVIAVLTMMQRASVNALAAALATDKGWISRTVAALSERGLIAARGDPSDARKVELELSRKGLALYERIVPAAAERQSRLLQVLSAAERTALDRILHKLQTRADEMLAERAGARRRVSSNG